VANEIGRDETKISQLMPPPRHPGWQQSDIVEQVSQLFVDYDPPELLAKLIVTFWSESNEHLE